MSAVRKLKILHLTYDMRIGGTEQVIKNLVDNTDAMLFDSSVLCIESPLGPFATDLINTGIVVTAFSRSPGFDRKLIRLIRSYLKDNNIDILHCHQYTPWVYGVLAAFMTATKVIFTEHGRFYPDSSTWKRKLVNPWLHRITNRTTAISEATQHALAKYENLPIADVQVIYNGISPLEIDENIAKRLRNQLGIDEDTLCLGTVARFDPIKNHSMMLYAFRQVLNHGIKAKLVIVGDGEMRSEINRIISEQKMEQDVILTGYQADARHYLALMDIYLLSSLSEGTSMTLLEAMSISKPCVVTDAGGNPEIIIDKLNGLVTPNDDADAFAEAIIRLADDEELRCGMAKESLSRYKNKFSATSMCNQFKKLYFEVSK